MKYERFTLGVTETFVTFERDGKLWVELGEENLYNNLHILFHKFIFQRLVDFFILDKSQDSGSLILFLEHRDYPIRIYVKVKFLNTSLPLQTFGSLWKNAFLFELLINSSDDKYFIEKNEYFLCDTDNKSEYLNWKGSEDFYYQINQGSLSKIKMDLSFEQRQLNSFLTPHPLELFPIVLKEYFPEHYQSMNILFYKSIEEVLGLTPPHREQALRMILLEMDRIRETFSLLSNVFLKFNINVLYKITHAILLEIKVICSETPNEHFGLLFPRTCSSKFSANWIKGVNRVIEHIEIAKRKIERALQNNSYFYSAQSINLGELTYGSQLDGFLLKASGSNHDSRVFDPYYLYEQLDVQSSLGQQQKVIDIYFVWMEEIDISVKNLRLLIAGMPVYQKEENVPKVYNLQSFEELIGSAEQDFIAYSALDTVRGELGIWWTVNQGKPCFRLKGADSMSLFYFLDLVKQQPAENAFGLLPFLGIDLNEFIQ